ncbi:GNAT family N-acetyltransferase [Cellulomonas sp. JH27-2]|uniref:GNAT family N-acetyltransferase n=1 Tax=Cellulomonas sp. JH27-2 TaxID=2774139 RepID=UPI00177D603D|nr:GNAT family N-acetyltransferase [Cellulomonas sp. JH27-2]MBD8057995.1 GNAT family N-acetyltransferase [Cellulomonas sp. JH27-2]
MSVSPPVLSDGVVTLRCLVLDDAAEMLAGEDDDQVRWLNEGHRSEPTRQRRWIVDNATEWSTGGPRRHLGIVDVASGALAGTVEAHLAIPGLGAGTANISYAVFPRWRGRGYAVRAVRLLRRWLASATDIECAVLRVDPSNGPSLRVARDSACTTAVLGPDRLVTHELPVREAARVILTCGPAGSGKSAHARRLEAAGYERLSFDEEAWRRGWRRHPVPESAADEVQSALRASLVEHVTGGRDVVVDTSFWSRARRDAYRELLAPWRVTPVVHLQVTPSDEVLRRLSARTGAGPHDVLVPEDLARAYLAGFEIPTPDEGPMAVVEPDGGGATSTGLG